LTENYVALKAQKGRHLPLSGTSPAVSAGNCPASYADSGTFCFACEAGADLASLEPKLFCGVALTSGFVCARSSQRFCGIADWTLTPQ